MSTRTNIIIEHGESRIYLYRHCDGYPSCTGAHLVALLTAHKHADGFLRAILAEQYEGTSYDPKPRNIYELTTEVHGDIEYLYRVKFSREWDNPPKLVEIGVKAFSLDDGTRDLLDHASLGMVPLGTLAEFVELVNLEIREANKRMQDYYTKQGQAFEAQPEVATA